MTSSGMPIVDASGGMYGVAMNAKAEKRSGNQLARFETATLPLRVPAAHELLEVAFQNFGHVPIMSYGDGLADALEV